MYKLIWIALLLLSCKSGSSPAQESTGQESTSSVMDREVIANEMEVLMKKACLDPWYPAAIDTEYGGYYSDFDHQWKLDGKQEKMIVTQARHVWTAATVAEFYDEDPTYLEVGHHGFEFLKNKMWDEENGGFYQTVSRDGTPIASDDKYGIMKTAYGNAFGVYGLAAYARVSMNAEALALAKEAFMWLEIHSHDPIKGGYFQFLLEDGTPLVEGHTNPAKDQNSSIHLLEAFSELYRVWPDELVKERVREMLVLVRDTITRDFGSLTLFLDKDWIGISHLDSSEAYIKEHRGHDHISFGHDIETAYLLLEASHEIHDPELELTESKAKIMVDHTLATGWDEEHGGVYDGGYYFRDKPGMTIIMHHKAWWAQVEAMNTLLIMSDMYPDDKMDYQKYFLQNWDYVNKYLVDKSYPGIFIGGLDQQPEAAMAPKGSIWKGNYHNVRSFLNCIKRLRDSGH